MIRCVIVEDEEPATLRLKKLIAEHPSLNIVGEADHGKQAIDQLEKLKPDLVFLDIHLPDMNGFDVLHQLTFQPMIIFTTAYSQYALEAFDSFSIDYLVKPISAERFAKSIDRLSKVHNSANKEILDEIKKKIFARASGEIEALPIKNGNKIILVDYAEINYIKAEDKCTIIFESTGKKNLSQTSLSKLEETLPSSFIRVHRSFIVNKRAIREIKKYFKGQLILILNDPQKTTIRTGEKYSKTVREELGI